MRLCVLDIPEITETLNSTLLWLRECLRLAKRGNPPSGYPLLSDPDPLLHLLFLLLVAPTKSYPSSSLKAA